MKFVLLFYKFENLSIPKRGVKSWSVGRMSRVLNMLKIWIYEGVKFFYPCHSNRRFNLSIAEYLAGV